MNMVRKGILFVISGPSGVGKGTIREALLPQVDNLYLSISATTRQPRQGETDGRDYYFVNQKKFLEMIDNQEFLEYAQVYNNMYGTPRSYVMENLEQGRDVLLEIDIQGAMQVKKNMPEAVFIFIQPPSVEELSHRLCGRGQDTKESIDQRLAACKDEMAQVVHYNYAILNDQVSDAVCRVHAVIIAERCRVK
jgi:guanylate kinase